MSSTAAASSEFRFSPGRPRVEKPQRGRRARRAFLRYLIAICVGVAATLAWQSYGDMIKQTVATRAPALGWSPEVQQLIVALVQEVGWDKPAVLERNAPQAPAQTVPQTSVAQGAFDPAAYKPSASPSPTVEQVQQIVSDLATLKQAVGQLSSNQDQMAQDIAKVQATDQEVLNKVSANKVAAPPPRPATMPGVRHPPASPAPMPPQPLQLR